MLDILGFILEIGKKKKKINREEDVKYKELLVGSFRERELFMAFHLSPLGLRPRQWLGKSQKSTRVKELFHRHIFCYIL